MIYIAIELKDIEQSPLIHTNSYTQVLYIAQQTDGIKSLHTTILPIGGIHLLQSDGNHAISERFPVELV